MPDYSEGSYGLVEGVRRVECAFYVPEVESSMVGCALYVRAIGQGTCYAMSEAALVQCYQALRTPYAMSGTDLACANRRKWVSRRTRLPVASYGPVRPCP
eukprot:686288-Rhodomonas_salina.1